MRVGPDGNAIGGPASGSGGGSIVDGGGMGGGSILGCGGCGAATGTKTSGAGSAFSTTFDGGGTTHPASAAHIPPRTQDTVVFIRAILEHPRLPPWPRNCYTFLLLLAKGSQ
ncbi:hypothetical protein VHAB30_24800 [Variovorax boronicumulans]|nr:hypothetical protein VHAB30_24800 [Variovorax boronicumulans]